MSSDPDRYPIKPGIVPLVYAFYKMWKRPKVWFYSQSACYPKLIAQVINGLQGQHKINPCWRVRILPFSQSMFSTTYSIEPLEVNVSLHELQVDILMLGKVLRHDLLLLRENM